MAMTLAAAQNMLNAYIAAETQVLEGKAITFNGRSMSMENLGEIRKGRQEWERKVASLSRRPGYSGFKLASF
ncbi:MAG: primosomal replication protein PriB/PriC domain protein [Pseudomonas sp.]|nr:primosomal replication protein PriB/PriC domain protein [Pseudomonas sp.]